MNTYDIGDVAICSAAFALSGVATDPTTITFRIREPDGVVTTYVYGTDNQLVRDSAGNYHVNWSVTKAGRHVYRFIGTGTVATAEETVFYVRPSGI